MQFNILTGKNDHTWRAADREAAFGNPYDTHAIISAEYYAWRYIQHLNPSF
jgi:hypothetical protein